MFVFIPTVDRGPIEPVVLTQIRAEQLKGPGLDASLWKSYLYVAREENGVEVLDIRVPNEPVFAGEYIPPRPENAWLSTRRVTAGANYAVALEKISTEDQINSQLRLLNIQDPAHVVDAGTIDIGPSFTHVDLTANNRQAFILFNKCADEGACRYTILMIDLETGANVSRLELPGEAFDLYAKGNYLYVAAGNDGLYVWNVTDPGSPVLAVHLTHPGFSRKVAVEGGWVYLSDLEGGLFIYKGAK